MNALLVALVMSQFPTPFTVKDEGVPKGTASGVNCTGAGVTCSIGVGGVWTLDAAAGSGGGAPTTAQYWTGAADGGLSAEKNLGALATGLVLNTAGVPSAYAGATCTTPNLVQVLSSSGAPTCYQLKLDDLANPGADKTFTMANKVLTFSFTAPVAGTGGAFELDAVGGFSGDLLHVHQHIGNPGAGTDLVHLEFDDTDVNGLRITGPSSAAQAATITGKVDVTGQVTATSFSGPLSGAVTGNASTASALASDPVACGAGTYATDISAAGVLTCSTPPGTYSLPDAAAATKGGILLTGDLGGTASSPAVVDDSHAHTTTTISGLDAANDISSGTLGQARGGTGAGALTCTGTQKLTSNGTAYSCAADQDTVYTLPAATASVLGGVKGTGSALVCSGTDKATGFAADGTLQCGTDQTSAGGGYATVQDEGGGLTQRTTLNFAGAGVSCADDTTRTTCTIAGGGGSPGGSNTQLQYNSSSSFAGATYATINGTGNLVIPASAEPAAPSSGAAIFTEDRGDLGLPAWMTIQGYDRYMQPHWGFEQIAMMFPAGGATGTTAPSVIGMTVTHEGTTIANPGPASTNYYTSLTRITSTSGTTVGNPAGWRAGALRYWRGNSATTGGFHCHFRWCNDLGTASSRGFIGLSASVAARANQNPSSDVNFLGAFWDSTDTAIRLGGNDGTGSGAETTVTTCSATDYPPRTQYHCFSLDLAAKKNATQVTAYLKRLDTTGLTACTATISAATNLPAATQFLAPRIHVQTTITTAVGVGIPKMYCEQDN